MDYSLQCSAHYKGKAILKRDFLQNSTRCSSKLTRVSLLSEPQDRGLHTALLVQSQLQIYYREKLI